MSRKTRRKKERKKEEYFEIRGDNLYEKGSEGLERAAVPGPFVTIRLDRQGPLTRGLYLSTG